MVPTAYPFPTLKENVAREMVKNGRTAYIDPRFNERSFAESKLVEIIPQCWTYNPRQRIDIFQLVNFLRNAVQENKLREAVPGTGYRTNKHRN